MKVRCRLSLTLLVGALIGGVKIALSTGVM